ncbi:heparinase II/III family protein [Terrihabitans sp. B22-R8]|uniref:heparinase II/III family protein n=1 Tax=Terrihabitans sp. B22-R8 TaxID=3425128 RepID=UPI00403C3DE7
MAIDAIADGARTLFRLAALVGAQGLARLSPRRLLRLTPPLAMPSDIRPVPASVASGDAARGVELYGGVFEFAGYRVEAGGISIFAHTPPSSEWARHLQGFAWLADLAATENALSRAYARTLVEEWAANSRLNRTARQPDIAACRLIRLLTHAGFLLDGAEEGFRRTLLRILGRQTANLRRDLLRLPAGLARLYPAIALTAAGLALPDQARALRIGTTHLNTELPRLVLPDGGPATRNPADLLAWAENLLPLLTAFNERALEPPRELMPALDRMLPMLRFFRHPGGALALFNGMGPTAQQRLDAVLARDDAHGNPVLNASFSGYQRLEAPGTMVIADTGMPPPMELSRTAHAGTLSFEFSAQRDRIVVNCGAPARGVENMRRAARRTAAHSTLTIADASSSRFLKGWIAGLAGSLLREGPRSVIVAREDRSDARVLRASHDGYAARFGFVHERILRLQADGRQLEGLDVLRPVRAGSAEAVLRFHLHPGVRATRLNEGRAVLLVPPSGDVWLFSCDDHLADIEESVFFAGPDGPVPSEQISVSLGRQAGMRVSWSFTQTGSEVAPAALGLS